MVNEKLSEMISIDNRICLVKVYLISCFGAVILSE